MNRRSQLVSVVVVLTALAVLAGIFAFKPASIGSIKAPARVMTVDEAFPLIAEASVMESGRSEPHKFMLYSDGMRTAVIGNVSTYAGYRPAKIIFDANGTLLYRPPDEAYDKPAAIKYAGTVKLLYGILPPKLILESATFNETSGLYSGSIPYYSPLMENTSYYLFTILAWTPEGFIKEYEVVDPLDLRYPSAVVSFEKILKQGQSAIIDFDYDVFSLPDGTEYHAPDDFGVGIA